MKWQGRAPGGTSHKEGKGGNGAETLTLIAGQRENQQHRSRCLRERLSVTAQANYGRFFWLKRILPRIVLIAGALLRSHTLLVCLLIPILLVASVKAVILVDVSAV